ncbi:hypothetical protein [Nonomuraea sp. NPDC048901]|uniref:hypothetical protein n=1 Tax=Nonomuraea sp. NPDC048901 TaxID=3155627 RepID=UPI0033D8023B
MKTFVERPKSVGRRAAIGTAVRMFTGSGHPALNAVREAVNAVRIQPRGTVQPLTSLRARLDAAVR